MLPHLALFLLLAGSPAEAFRLRPAASLGGEPLALELQGLVAPARGRAGAFLFGSLRAAHGDVRSLLLRSTDGGAHWTEVMAPVEGSAVLFVQLAGCEGWALVGWTVEGPGELSLHASRDCGRSWQRRSVLEKQVYSEWAVRMRFEGGSRGEVVLADTNAPEGAPHRVLRTEDGGRTWTSRALPAPPGLEAPEAPRLEAPGWRIEVGEERVRVLRQRGGAWQARAEVSREWEVRRGRLLPLGR